MIGLMLQELMVARGAPAKITVLKKYDCHTIREVLDYTYNSEYVYHIRPEPISPMNCFDRDIPLEVGELELLCGLKDKLISGNNAHSQLEHITALCGPLLKLILARDLQVGIAATTINKAFPGLIPQFKVMLAKEVPLDKVKFPCYAQLKYDGVRIVTTIKDNEVKFRTRNGKVVLLPKLAKLIGTSCNDMMLDGELVIRGGKMTDRTGISGMVNSAMHGGSILEERLEYAIFDHMTIKEFETCDASYIYSERYKCAAAIVLGINNPMVTIARNQLVKSPQEVEALARQLYTDGMEGLILKHPTHKYTFKRSKEWIKIKETKTADLTVVEGVEGAGQFQGMVGALACTGQVEGRTVWVAVGSGLSTIQREVPLDQYNDLTVEVAYNSVIRDSKTGKWSLFLPRFICVRIDK